MNACAGKIGWHRPEEEESLPRHDRQLAPEFRIAQKAMSPSPADPSVCHLGTIRVCLSPANIAAQLGGDLGKRERELVPEAIFWLPTTP